MKSPLFALFVSLGLIGSASAVPITYNIFQGGYDEGATVTGMFTAEDVNGNGQITYFNTAPGSELTSFMLTFSGNSIIPAFTAGLGNITGFIWDLDPIFGDGRGPGPLFPEGTRLFTGIGNVIFRYETGFSPLSQQFPVKGELTNLRTGAVSQTTSFVTVSPNASQVPDGGATLAMLGASLAGIGGLLRLGRRQAES